MKTNQKKPHNEEKLRALGVYCRNITWVVWNACALKLIENSRLLEAHKLSMQDLYENFEQKYSKPKKSNIHTKQILYPILSLTSDALKGTNLIKLQYNYCLVAFVSSFEVFFKDTFIELIDKSSEYREKVYKLSKKINLKFLEDYKNGKIKIGEIIADEYNFQNLDSIQAAYKTIGLDFYKLLNSKVIFKNRNINTINCIHDLLEKRHKLVHNGKIDNSIDLDEIGDYYQILLGIGIDVLYHWKFPLRIKGNTHKNRYLKIKREPRDFNSQSS
ncbi:MAG TPA: HEPN domain-containing protein [Candidatus Nanoarchaeia archaeon]|nr:HEPN domain-containing protein [Candidatus Nanoarchaeia archaeon]